MSTARRAERSADALRGSASRATRVERGVDTAAGWQHEEVVHGDEGAAAGIVAAVRGVPWSAYRPSEGG
ncbi:unnamed protein product [Scytosiphon promiscuus]